MNMKRVVRLLLSWLSGLMVGVLVVLAVLLAGVRLVGFQPYTVLSGSMEPELPVGALVYVRGAEPEELAVGDVITFAISDHMVATHRIVAVVPGEDGLQFQTKGDANDAVDGEPVDARNIIGRVAFSIPRLGYLADYIQQPSGRYAAAALCMAALVISFLPELIFGGEGKKK